MTDDQHSTTDSQACVQQAYLYFARDLGLAGPSFSVEELDSMAFDPDEVTCLAGLQPTFTGRRGDSHPNRPEGRRFSTWMYEMAEVPTYFTEDVVIELLDVIEPHAAGIAAACAGLDLQAGINVVIEMSGADGDTAVSTAAVTYSARTLKRLARLDLCIAHDQYV